MIARTTAQEVIDLERAKLTAMAQRYRRREQFLEVASDLLLQMYGAENPVEDDLHEGDMPEVGKLLETMWREEHK